MFTRLMVVVFGASASTLLNIPKYAVDGKNNGFRTYFWRVSFIPFIVYSGS